SAPAAAAATTAAAWTAAARAGARTLLPAERARVRASAILLRLALRLQRKRAEHHDPLSFLETARHFGVIEVALAELNDARGEPRLGAVGDETESRALTRTRREFR